MNFLKEAMRSNSVFASLQKNIKRGRSLCVSGLSAVTKAGVIFSLCADRDEPALCIASDEREAQTLCNDLCCMGLNALVYPVRDYNFLDFQSMSTNGLKRF